MSNAAAVSVVLRLVGVWIIVHNLWLWSLFPQLFSENFSLANKASIIGQTAWFLFGLFLTLWPTVLAKRITPRSERGQAETDWTPETFRTVAFQAVGLFFLIRGLASQSTWGAVFLIFSVEDRSTGWVNFGTVLEAVVGIGAGIWLVVGAPGMKQMVRTTRRARLDNNLP